MAKLFFKRYLEGISFIDKLINLGKILEYFPKTEFPIDKGKRQNPAVDVAWLKEHNQKFPLFIFEVESNTTNSMVYNPMKVFTKENEEFEKPLFFFQILLKGGQNSSRVKDLKRQYGTYNYRIYRLQSSEEQKLLEDILKQHRRISNKLNLIELIGFLKKNNWFNLNLVRLLKLIIKLDFNRYNNGVLRELATLAQNYDEFKPVYLEHIISIHSDPIENLDRINYKGRIAQSWCFPLHLGIIFHETTDLYWQQKAMKQLVYWQEEFTYMSMIGPHFGLARDYDDFLVWEAGSLIGLIAALFKQSDYIRLYLSDILMSVIKATRDRYQIPNLVWLHYIIPQQHEKSDKYKEFLHTSFNNKNINLKYFLSPIFFEENEQYINFFHEGEYSYNNIVQLIDIEILEACPVEITLQTLNNFIEDPIASKKIISYLRN